MHEIIDSLNYVKHNKIYLQGLVDNKNIDCYVEFSTEMKVIGLDSNKDKGNLL